MKSRKPGSIVIKAELRLKGMKMVDNTLGKIIDYGGNTHPLTSLVVAEQIDKCITANDKYNDSLKAADERALIVKEEEQKLTEMYSRILSGCVSKFGVDAEEVSILGGTRLSERKSKSKNI
jgi:hypothetical protein